MTTIKHDLYQDITDHIVSAIQQGAKRYDMPWHRGGITQARPANALTGRQYQGINVIALWVFARKSGFGSGYWGTYRQWKTLGAQVRKGEKSSPVVLYKQIERNVEKQDSEENETRRYLYARAFRVFNADQVEGWNPPESSNEVRVGTITRAAMFIDHANARIEHGGEEAYYEPKGDYIQMPETWRFKDTDTSTATEGYYATLLHEVTHWTGHSTRLGRDFTGRFGDESYAMEELVAELGAAFLCADLGVTNTPREGHAAYVGAWLTVLKRDKKAIFTAAGKAQQAADYLAGLQTESGTQPEVAQ